MKMRLRLAVVLSALCCLCASFAPAQGGKGAPPPPVQPQGGAGTLRAVEELASPAGWKRYEIKYGAGDTLSFAFPLAPEESASKSDVPNSGTVVVHMFTATTEGTLMLAGYMEFFSERLIKITPEVRDLIFDDFWKNFSSGMQSGMAEKGVNAKITATERRKVTISGRDALEQDFTVADFAGRYRAFAGDHNLYVAVGIARDPAKLKERDDFLGSLKLVPQP